jgi:hypothetical protein
MPYIPQEDRDRAYLTPRTPGELNYAITRRMINAWEIKNPLAVNAMAGGIRQMFFIYWSEKIQNYTTINDILGATAGAIMEFRRRVQPKAFGPEGIARQMIVRAISKVVDGFYNEVAARYEDSKIEENGDVYS